LRAIQHVLAHSEEFAKSDFVRTLLRRILGESLLVAEGAPHRAQRRVMNPAFGPVQVRELSSVFLDKANEVRPAQRYSPESSSLTSR
jgi:cytochrome P450